MFVITSQPLPYHPFPVHHGAVVCMTRSTGYFVVRSLGPWEGLVFFHHFLRFLAKVRLWKPPLHGVGHGVLVRKLVGRLMVCSGFLWHGAF